ncbi:MAG: TonB family protein [Bacteroidales bacterium]|nr:TonB family protein [Bacteroidales bacterium]
MKGITEILVLMLLLPFFAEAQKEYICIDPSEDDEPVYMKVEKMPAYPGGMRELIKDIEENLVYPEDAKKNGIQGVVVVLFVVDKKGSIVAPRILQSKFPVLNSAAIDVLFHLKPFEPGEHRGEKVNVYFDVPIQFRLDK